MNYSDVVFKRLNSSEQPQYLSLFGLFSVLLYTLFKMAFPSIENLVLTLASFICFWCLYKYGKEVNSHLLFRFVLASIFIQMISWGLSLCTDTEWEKSDFHIDYMTRFFVFIPLSWWVAQYKNAIWWVYISAAIAIFMTPWITGHGFQEIHDGIYGKRIDLGIHNAQHTSLFFGVVFLGLLCFSKLLYIKNKFFVFPAVFFIFYSILIVYLSSSRQSWLALLVTGFLFASYFTIKRFKVSSGKRKILTIVLFLVAILSVGGTLVNSDKIVKRVMAEKEFLAAIISLNFDAVPYSSFGIRLHSWEASIAFITEKPLFGWGGDGRTSVIQHTDWLPENIRQNFGHLHNTYLEILVNFGVVGLVFYFYVWFYFSKQIYRRVKSGELEKEIGYFYFSFLCFWAVMNCFEAYQSYWTGTYILHVFLAGIFGRIWYLDIHKARKNNAIRK